MSKVLKLDTSANSLHDGKFELIADKWTSKLRLAAHFLRLAIFGVPHAQKYHQYTFTTVDNATPVQLDGEIERIPGQTDVTITAETDMILSLY